MGEGRLQHTSQKGMFLGRLGQRTCRFSTKFTGTCLELSNDIITLWLKFESSHTASMIILHIFFENPTLMKNNPIKEVHTFTIPAPFTVCLKSFRIDVIYVVLIFF